jgi:hypothetical protein
MPPKDIMKTSLPILLVTLGLLTNANAADKDILRDACAAVKSAPKRSECFDAIERLSAKPGATAADAKRVATTGPLKVNARAFGECAALEYAEIDSMPREELEGLYCSYSAGANMALRLGDAAVAKQTNLTVKAALLGDQIRTLDRCTHGLSKAIEAFHRKYPGEKPDCSKMPEKFAPLPRETQAVSPTDGLTDSARRMAREALIGSGCDPVGDLHIVRQPYKQDQISSQCSGSSRWQTVSCSEGSCHAVEGAPFVELSRTSTQ